MKVKIATVVATTGLLDPGMALADIDIADGITEGSYLSGRAPHRDRRQDTYSAASGRLAIAVDG